MDADTKEYLERINDRLARLLRTSATHAALTALEEELRHTSAELRAEMAAMHDELRGEMSAMRDELRAELHTVRDELRNEIQAVQSPVDKLDRLTNPLIKEFSLQHGQLAFRVATVEDELDAHISQSQAGPKQKKRS